MISQTIINLMLGPGRATGAGQGAFDRGGRTRSTWERMRGTWVPPRTDSGAPCPRCGVDLRSRAHDRHVLEPFFEQVGSEITAGFRCRLKPPAPPRLVVPDDERRTYRERLSRLGITFPEPVS